MNLFDRSLVPWGLLRTGVAPDHPEVKHTAQAWSNIGDYESFQYYGGVEVGKSQFKCKHSKSIDLSTLIANHDAVLLANGAYKARSLNLCQSSRIISAQEWLFLIIIILSEPTNVPLNFQALKFQKNLV